jgi:hypothetical protein
MHLNDYKFYIDKNHYNYFSCEVILNIIIQFKPFHCRCLFIILYLFIIIIILQFINYRCNYMY